MDFQLFQGLSFDSEGGVGHCSERSTGPGACSDRIALTAAGEQMGRDTCRRLEHSSREEMVVVWPRVLAAEVLALPQPSGSHQWQEDGGQVGTLQTSPLTLLGVLLRWLALLAALPGL